MKKLLFGIGLGTLGVVGAATPLIVTSCGSTLKSITINLDEIKEGDDAFTYEHNFFGSEEEGTFDNEEDSIGIIP